MTLVLTLILVLVSVFTGMIFNEADQQLRDSGYHRHAFNLLISTRLGYHRELPDTRDPQ